MQRWHWRVPHRSVAAAVGGEEDGSSVATKEERRRSVARCGVAVVGIMSTLLVYGVLQGVPELGYLFWTTSDNQWELADGYGHKFGIVAVDHANNIACKPRSWSLLLEKIQDRIECVLRGRCNKLHFRKKCIHFSEQ